MSVRACYAEDPYMAIAACRLIHMRPTKSHKSRAGLGESHDLPVLKEVPMKAKGPFQSGVTGLGSIPRSKDTGCDGPSTSAS